MSLWENTQYTARLQYSRGRHSQDVDDLTASCLFSRIKMASMAFSQTFQKK